MCYPSGILLGVYMFFATNISSFQDCFVFLEQSQPTVLNNHVQHYRSTLRLEPAWILYYDIRYKYEQYYDEQEEDYLWRMKEDTGRGWWYEYEPESGYHKPGGF